MCGIHVNSSIVGIGALITMSFLQFRGLIHSSWILLGYFEVSNAIFGVKSSKNNILHDML